MQLQAQLHDLQTEKIAIATQLEDKTKQVLDLQANHRALSDTLAAEQQALLEAREGQDKLTEQEVILLFKN